MSIATTTPTGQPVERAIRGREEKLAQRREKKKAYSNKWREEKKVRMVQLENNLSKEKEEKEGAEREREGLRNENEALRKQLSQLLNPDGSDGDAAQGDLFGEITRLRAELRVERDRADRSESALRKLLLDLREQKTRRDRVRVGVSDALSRPFSSEAAAGTHVLAGTEGAREANGIEARVKSSARGPDESGSRQSANSSTVSMGNSQGRPPRSSVRGRSSDQVRQQYLAQLGMQTMPLSVLRLDSDADLDMPQLGSARGLSGGLSGLSIEEGCAEVSVPFEQPAAGIENLALLDTSMRLRTGSDERSSQAGSRGRSGSWGSVWSSMSQLDHGLLAC